MCGDGFLACRRMFLPKDSEVLKDGGSMLSNGSEIKKKSMYVL
jgi:hypothetical protein